MYIHNILSEKKTLIKHFNENRVVTSHHAYGYYMILIVTSQLSYKS